MKFFPHAGLFAQAVGIEGGAGDIGRFLNIFYSPPSRVNLKLRKQSVIIITDNDKACNPIFNRLNNAHKKSIAITNSAFAHKLQDHFYLLKAPHVGTKVETCIEDMIPAAVLSQSFDGKTFEADPKKYDPDKNVGKTAFAALVAKRNNPSDYAGFRKYLQKLDQCVSQTL